MRAFEKVDFPAPAGPVTKTAYLILGRVKVPGAKQCADFSGRADGGG